MTGPAFNLVNNTLQAMGRKVTQDGRGGVLAQCPAHDDGRPSLHVTDGDGGVLLYCFAGCPVDDVREALGLAKRDLFDDPEGARYRYDDGRIVRRTPDKRFSQSGNTKATPTLYRRAEVAQAVTDGRTVYLVEGEKDADNLRKLAHVTATTAPMGGGNFAKVDASPLTGADVVAVVDRDATGAKWARQVRDKLAGVASLRLVEAASGKDASDHLAAGLGVGDFLDHEDALDLGDALTASGRPAGRDWGDENLRSHHRIAARFAHYAEGRVLYVDGIGWHQWDGTRWALDRHGAVTNALLRDLLAESWAEAMRDRNLEADVRASMTATGTTGVLSLASTHGRLFAVDTDADPWLLNVRNGTLDLHTLELRPHDPSDRLTKITRAAYHPDVTSARWDDFLASSLPDVEVRDFLARYAGLALVGRVIEHVLVIATGTGRNGKGVLSGAVRSALGDYAVTAPSTMLTAGRYGHSSASELAAKMILRGARWVVMSELDKGDQMAEATMKFLTGGDSIPAKLMGQNYVEFKPSHSLFMLTNNLPEVDANDAAVWDRLRIVPFDVSFAGREDTALEADLELDADAILTWAVHGLRAYHERGLGAPDAVTRRTAEYRSDNDPLRRFLDEECVLHPAATVAKGDLHAAYTRWAAEAREAPISARAFSVLLKALPRVSESNSGARKWHGVGLAAEDENALDYGLQRKQRNHPEILTENGSRESLGPCVVSVVDPVPTAKSGQGNRAEDPPPESPGSHLVASLAGLPDRCPSCGWHTPTQGHADTCQMGTTS